MAAEDSDLERTEPASPQRLQKAREEGDVPRSRELATCTLLMASVAAFWTMGGNLVERLNHMLATGLSFQRADAFDHNVLFEHIAANLWEVLLAFAPVAVLLVLVALASPLLIGGWLFSGKALAPNFDRLNPFNGIGNLFSSRSLVELGKAIAKTLLVGWIAWSVVQGQLPAVLGLALEPVNDGTAHTGHLILVTFAAAAAGLVAVAAIDVPYQMWSYANKLKMTREELRQEAKESDGNPEIKAKIRQQQREIARRRMMSEIPKADVVVTNPTHFAVALKYTEGGNGAPRVVAKGADILAAKIREIATENGVPLLEAPPLARALYTHTELGDEIPQMLYTAVAEVLAYVFQLRAFKKSGGQRPDRPTDIAVPPLLDPQSEESAAFRAAKEAARQSAQAAALQTGKA